MSEEVRSDGAAGVEGSDPSASQPPEQVADPATEVADPTTPVSEGGVPDPGEAEAGGQEPGLDLQAAEEAAAHQAAQQAAEQQAAEEAAAQQAAEEQAAQQGAAQPSEPPPEGNKRKKRKKIDLKSRLSNVRASGSMAAKSAPTERKSDPLSFPPPPGGSVPAPKISGPSPMVSSPFAPPEPEKKPSGQQQTIKVEMGEEVQQERQRASKRTALYAALAAVVALVLGFFVGGAREKGAQGRKAVENAEALAADVKAANEEMTKMSDALRGAVEKMRTDQYPSELADVLKKTNVPFGPENFKGRAVGGLPPAVFNQLMSYTNGVAKLNKQKKGLQRMLSISKKRVNAFLEAKEDPKVKYSVLLGKSDDKYFVDFAVNKEPFEAEGDWPAEYTVLQKGAKGKPKEVEATVWNGDGKLGGNDDYVLPVQVEGLPDALSDKLPYLQLIKKLTETKQLIDGNDSRIPQEQTDGLLKDGQQLIDGLNKVAAAGA